MFFQKCYTVCLCLNSDLCLRLTFDSPPITYFCTCSPLTQFKTLKVEEYNLALRNLELHYQNFMKDSQDSEIFGADDRLQAENGFQSAKQHYDVLLQSVEQGGSPVIEHTDLHILYIH